jgi:hypothetical protein
MLSTIIQLIYFICLPLCVTMDSPFYLGAGWIQAHHLYFPVQDVRTPGYSTFLSAFFLFTPNLLVISLAQHLSIALVAGLCTHVLSRRTSAWAASLCGLLIGICPALGLYSSFMMSDALFSTLLIAFILAIIGCLGKSPHYFSWIGVLSGLMVLVRPNGLLIVLLSAILLYPFLPGESSVRSERVPFEQRYSFRLLFWCFATILPWMVYRGMVTGHFGLLAPNRSASLQMEMVLGIANNEIEEYLDSPFKGEVSRLKELWDESEAENRPGVSFYYYLNSELIKIFGPERVSEFYEKFLWRYFISRPGSILDRIGLITLSHASILPPFLAKTLLPGNETVSSDVADCSQNTRVYQSAIRMCSFGPFDSQITEAKGSLSGGAILQLPLSAWWYLLWAISCLGFARGFMALRQNTLPSEARTLISICLLSVLCSAVGYALFLKGPNRYALPLQPLLCIACALTFPKRKNGEISS